MYQSKHRHAIVHKVHAGLAIGALGICSASALAAPAGFAVGDLRRYGAAQVTFLTPDGAG